MQLKRDVDYALRLLLCVAKQKQTKGKKNGLTVLELSKNTAIPMTIVSRLCNKMKEERLLKVQELCTNNIEYTIGRNTLNKTLFDVIRAIEGCSGLFSVFDKSTALYKHCQPYFEKIERQFEVSLEDITLKELLEKIENTERISASK